MASVRSVRCARFPGILGLCWRDAGRMTRRLHRAGWHGAELAGRVVGGWKVCRAAGAAGLWQCKAAHGVAAPSGALPLSGVLPGALARALMRHARGEGVALGGAGVVLGHGRRQEGPHIVAVQGYDTYGYT